ncbi:unnamed protein product [Ilex paraguariensis]|uniref:Uncharacterized protein n=1 Tax=Ilex paraguariensis TaxID=185542 RepID=A0ABC8RIE1_9AQUA
MSNFVVMAGMAKVVVGAVAGLALAAWGIAMLFSGPKPETETSTNGETMTAPGRDGRDDFDKDPGTYYLG